MITSSFMARHDVVHERQTDILFYHNISLVLASAPMKFFFNAIAGV